MPRFYFHSEDGHLTHDDTGTELEDENAARLEATVRLGNALQRDPAKFWETGFLRVLVSDASRRILLSVETSAAAGVNVIPRLRAQAR